MRSWAGGHRETLPTYARGGNRECGRASRVASECERHMAAVVEKGMAVMGFRNTPIEDFHDRTAW